VGLLSIIAATALFFVVASKFAINLPQWLEFSIIMALAIVLWFGWSRLSYWPLTRLIPELKPLRQITVADLVAAARRGSW
jgi:hypothetical protein